MSNPQIIYAVWLAALFLLSGEGFAKRILAANMVAILAVCGLMDIGAVGRTQATGLTMCIDIMAGVLLVTRSGTARLVAWGYAITVPIYSLNLWFGYSESATFALVYVIAYAQLGVVTIGTLTGPYLRSNGGRHYMRRHIGDLSYQNGQPRFGLPKEKGYQGSGDFGVYK